MWLNDTEHKRKILEVTSWTGKHMLSELEKKKKIGLNNFRLWVYPFSLKSTKSRKMFLFFLWYLFFFLLGCLSQRLSKLSIWKIMIWIEHRYKYRKCSPYFIVYMLTFCFFPEWKFWSAALCLAMIQLLI